MPLERRLFPLAVLHSLNDRFHKIASLVRLAIGKTHSLMPGPKQIAATYGLPASKRKPVLTAYEYDVYLNDNYVRIQNNGYGWCVWAGVVSMLIPVYSSGGLHEAIDRELQVSASGTGKKPATSSTPASTGALQ